MPVASFGVPSAKRYEPAGLYPSGYRVAWDAKLREFRIALTGLEARS